MTWFLGGSQKLLATVCDLESTMSNYACIWCKCPKNKQFDITLQWSINDSANGARSIQEISDKAKLSMNSTHHFNCSNKPIFPFIPMVIYHLHLFLRISDVLITLVIWDLQITDDLHGAKGTLQTKEKRETVKYISVIFKWSQQNLIYLPNNGLLTKNLNGCNVMTSLDLRRFANVNSKAVSHAS